MIPWTWIFSLCLWFWLSWYEKIWFLGNLYQCRISFHGSSFYPLLKEMFQTLFGQLLCKIVDTKHRCGTMAKVERYLKWHGRMVAR